MSNIHTLHSLVICVRRLSVLGFCYVCGRRRVIFTHLFACLFVFKLIISVHGCYTPVTGRRGPHQLGDPRPVADRHDPSTFSGVGVHYLKFTSTIPFRDMTSGMTVENDSWWVGNPWWSVANRHPFCDPLRIGYIGHEWNFQGVWGVGHVKNFQES